MYTTYTILKHLVFPTIVTCTKKKKKKKKEHNIQDMYSVDNM
jgi:hypothetical protein